MWSTCSMSTGHCSTQAPQVVQDHSTSGSMTPPSSAIPTSGRACVGLAAARPSGPTRPRPRRPRRRRPGRERRRRLRPPAEQVRRLGEHVVAQVHDQQLGRQRLARCSRPGTGDWQRPHSVQVAKSSMPFQVKSSILPRPKTSSSSGSSKSIGFGRRSTSAAAGRARSGRAGEADVERRQEDVQVLGVERQHRKPSTTPI